MHIVVGVLFVFCIGCSGQLWDKRWPSPTTASVASGAYGNGKFLVIGEQGTLLQSYNGTEWDECYSPLDGNYRYSSFTNGFYLRSDTEGAIGYSSTGECFSSWVLRGEGDENLVNLISEPTNPNEDYTGGFVGISDFMLYYSASGDYSDWNLISPVNMTQYKAWGLAYGDGFWMVKLADYSSEDPYAGVPLDIYFTTSSDGMTWSPLVSTGLTAYHDYSLSFCSGVQQWVAGFYEGIGRSAYSGLAWTISQSGINEFVLNSLTCYQDRCVGVNQNTVFETDSCSNNYEDVTPENLSVIRGSFPIVSSSGTFVIGGDNGAIYYSNIFKEWESSGSLYSEISLFLDCEELVYGDDYFYSACFRSILVSKDGESWASIPYKLASDSSIQLTSLTWAQDKLWALGGDKRIYSSKNNAETWSLEVTLQIQQDDDMDLDSLHYVHDSFFGLGMDKYSGSDIPLVIQSDGEQWKVIASSYKIYSIAYTKDKDLQGHWIGAGEGGLYISDDLSTWDMIEPVNGDCWSVVSSPSYEYFIAQCSNKPSADSVTYDDILMTSSDGGDNWTVWYSPCYLSHRETQQKEVCNSVEFIKGWNAFVLTSNMPTGGIHTTLLNNFAVEWHRAYFPFAVSFMDMAEGEDIIASLTQNVIFSGESAALPITSSRDGVLYNETRTTNAPNYPAHGVIAIIPDSDSSNSNNHSDSSEMDGGEITGIIFGSLIGAFFVVLLCAAIGVLALIVYNRTPKTSTETASILNDEGL